MTVSIKFHTDPALLVPVTNVPINHLVDGTSDPQDFLFYFGSTIAANKFQDITNPGVDNLSVTITNATTIWTPASAKVVSNTVRTTAKNGFRFKVTAISGTGLTGALEPTWPIVVGQTVVDNEVTWSNDGKIHESTEIKIASTLIGLDTAIAGTPLVLAPTINGGSASAFQVHMRIDDATQIVSQMTELSLSVVNISETPI